MRMFLPLTQANSKIDCSTISYHTLQAYAETAADNNSLKLNNDRKEHKLCQFILNLFHSILYCCARRARLPNATNLGQYFEKIISQWKFPFAIMRSMKSQSRKKTSHCQQPEPKWYRFMSHLNGPQASFSRLVIRSVCLHCASCRRTSNVINKFSYYPIGNDVWFECALKLFECGCTTNACSIIIIMEFSRLVRECIYTYNMYTSTSSR